MSHPPKQLAIPRFQTSRSHRVAPDVYQPSYPVSRLECWPILGLQNIIKLPRVSRARTILKKHWWNCGLMSTCVI